MLISPKIKNIAFIMYLFLKLKKKPYNVNTNKSIKNAIATNSNKNNFVLSFGNK